MGASHGRADQLAALTQGPPVYESVHPWGRAVGVGHGGKGEYQGLGNPRRHIQLGRGFFVRSVTLVGHTEKKALEIIGNDHSDKGGLENRLEVNML